jgi:uncharacterized protein
MLDENAVALVANMDAPQVHTHGHVSYTRQLGENDVTYVNSPEGTFLFKVFETREGTPRVYDAVSNEIHIIKQSEAHMLRSWDCSPEAKLAFANKYLTSMQARRWTFPDLSANSRAVRDGTIRTLVINTIEQCNIRCTYCYYGGAYEQTRPHQNARPRLEDVKVLLERFLDGNERSRGAWRAIYFFGGEPTLNFGLVEAAVRWFYQRAVMRCIDVGNVIIQVNTNGVLLDDAKMRFLDEFGVYLNFSIDGPNHDLYRVDARGYGTHDAVRAKLDWIAKAYPDYLASRVALVCVVSPPVNTRDLYDYFATWPSALQALDLDFDLLMSGGEVDYADHDLVALKTRLWELFIDVHGKTPDARSSSFLEWFTSSFNFLHRAFHRVMDRSQLPVRDGHLDSLLGVQGLPGFFLSMLGADGKLYATFEFQSDPFVVGNSGNGVDPSDAINRLREFRAIANGTACGTCWAARLCNIDYPDLAITGTDEPADLARKGKLKAKLCVGQRGDLADALSAHASIVEEFGDFALHHDRQRWNEEVASGNRPGFVL